MNQCPKERKKLINKMSIAVDFDGVLSNTIKKWIQIFNQNYSEKYPKMYLSYNKIKEWNFHKNFGITHDDSREIFKQCWEKWNSLEPTEFMLSQKTKTLSDMYNGLDIVTAITPTHKESIEKFLRKYKIQYDNIIFSENKEELDYTIFIDDSPDNAKKMFDCGKSVLLYNQPWNVDTKNKQDTSIHLSRVYSLDHAIYILQNKKN